MEKAGESSGGGAEVRGEPEGGPSSDHEMEEGEVEFLPGYPTFEHYSKALLSQVMAATKSSNNLPSEGDDFDYYISFPGYQTFCSKMATRVDRTINKMIRHHQLPCYWGVEDERGGVSEGSEVTRLEEKLETLVEANDVLLERANVLLDEVSGLRKNLDTPVMVGGVQQGTAEVASWNVKRDAVRKQFKFIHSRNVPRPQSKFRDKADNSNNPFIPRLKEKLNARVPLPDVYERLANPSSLSALIANAKEWAGSDERLAHPYKYEIENFDPTAKQLEIQEPQLPASDADTPFTFVTTLKQLEALREELKAVEEFAIDLEHHSYRSFLGFTCLMQISTRCHDYVIDTLEVRHHMHILLDPFTDPAIVKVMHGAEFDMYWMQRDFGLYVVNLFDTGQASRTLELPKFSLAFLLKYCCNVDADKQYQLADWRIRPLPQEMMQYARDDTHYLLYIYDRMRNELIRRGEDTNHMLQAVLKQSREICLRLYEKPIFDESDYLKLFVKHRRNFNSQQLHCLKLLYAWRDHLAREEDESPGYVLPNHMMFQIAEILPREPGGVLACCNPIPILLRQQQQEVYLLVKKARETPPTELPPLPSRRRRSSRIRNGTGASEGDVSNSRTETEEGGEMELVREEGEGEVEEGEVCRVEITIRPSGPPVKEAEPVITLLKAVKTKPLPAAVTKKLKEAAGSLPDILSQYEVAKEMTPAEVLIQQRLTYEALSASTWNQSSTEPPSAAASNNEEGSEVTEKSREREVAGKEKKRLSVRDMDSTDGGRSQGAAKKPRTSVGGAVGGASKGGDFQPFQYEGASYTQYTQGRDSPVEAYDPNSSGGRGTSEPKGASSRSRVKQKSGQRSQTYVPQNKRRWSKNK